MTTHTIDTKNQALESMHLICEECTDPISSVMVTVDEHDDGSGTVEDYLLSPCGHHARYLMVPIETKG